MSEFASVDARLIEARPRYLTLMRKGWAEGDLLRRSALWLILVGWGFSANAQSPVASGYRQANAYYEQGVYEKAVEKYEQIAGLAANGVIHYNLGNAYFRLGRRGSAILNYERARRLMPRDKDVIFNLKVARARNVDGFDLVKPPSGFSLIYGHLRADEIAWTGLTLCWLAAASFVAYQFLRQDRIRAVLRYVALATGVVWVCSLILLGLKVNDLGTPYAVVIADEVAVRSEPDVSADEIALPLHEGAKIQLQEARSDWVRIYLPDENVGWLPVEAIERI